MTNQTQETNEIKFSDVKRAGFATAVSVLNTVHNTARAMEHTTGILADKAENYRSQIAISDAIEHNALMLEFTKQAEEAGIDITNIKF